MAVLNPDDPLAEFIVSAPLYVWMFISLKVLKSPGNLEYEYVFVPNMVRRECVKCGVTMNWDREGQQTAARMSKEEVKYRCRNCRETFGVWFRWGKTEQGQTVCEKVGEFPKHEVNLPKELEKALGDHAKFWRQALTLRHHGYGLGALVYFRRIVEDSTGELLELLAVAMESRNEPKADIDKVRSLITDKVPFDIKMDQASKMIPDALRPGGENPFETIFQAVSTGLHVGTDEQGCSLVDALAEAVAELIGGLNKEIDSHKKLQSAAKTVRQVRDSIP